MKDECQKEWLKEVYKDICTEVGCKGSDTFNTQKEEVKPSWKEIETTGL